MTEDANNTPDGPVERKGMSLIEVMVAMVILSLLASFHTALTMRYAQRQQVVSLGAYRTAALQKLIGQYMAMPYDSLAVRTGCTTVSQTPTAPLGYTSCVTVTASGTQSSVQIIVTPSGLTRVDTITFVRGKVSTTSPLGS
jgi:prepilin-type N-terminal cleavage/methylation domain-containing protein